MLTKKLLYRFAFVTSLAGAALSAGCSDSDDKVDDNGKAISDLDIGSDLTLDKGATQQVTATVKYTDGTSADVTTSSDLVWNIGNTDVATISSTGLVTGVEIGATTIKASYQGKESATRALVVK